MMLTMYCVGPYEIQSVVTGMIRLDGGAMFGVVPKVLWKNVVDVDDANRIRLATRTLLAVDRSNNRVVLVDTGCGSKWLAEEAERYAIDTNPSALSDALAEHSLTPDDVTDVVITHLHFDHNGGLTHWFDEPGGRTCLAFPQATHWIHRSHWDHARNPHTKDKPSFLDRDISGLIDADRLQFVEGDKPAPPFEGLHWWVSHGHTPFQLHPEFHGPSESLLFVGDIAPTVAHLRAGWVMAYDVQPMTTIEEKQHVFRRCFEEGMGLAFPHDPSIGGVMIDGTERRPIVSRTLPL